MLQSKSQKSDSSQDEESAPPPPLKKEKKRKEPPKTRYKQESMHLDWFHANQCRWPYMFPFLMDKHPQLTNQCSWSPILASFECQIHICMTTWMLTNLTKTAHLNCCDLTQVTWALRIPLVAGYWSCIGPICELMVDVEEQTAPVFRAGQLMSLSLSPHFAWTLFTLQCSILCCPWSSLPSPDTISVKISITPKRTQRRELKDFLDLTLNII